MRAALPYQRVGHAAHVAAAILHPDQQGAACSVGEGHNRFQRAIRRGKITLELQRLALRALEQVEQIHIAQKRTRKQTALSLFRVPRRVRAMAGEPNKECPDKYITQNPLTAAYSADT